MARTMRFRITDRLKGSKLGLICYVAGRNFIFLTERIWGTGIFRKSFIAFGFPDNSLYGLNRFVDTPDPFHSFIEHGAFLGDYIHPVERRSNVKSIYCMGKRRAELLRGLFPEKQIVQIPPLMSAVNEVEPPLGDSIGNGYALVIMAHSTANLSARNSYLWLKDLARRKTEIVVLLYYADWHQADGLREIGVKAVTNGHKYDSSFLPRLKYVLQNADTVYTNSVGSHIGYCVSLGTKVVYHSSDNQFDAKNDEGTNQLKMENTVIRNQVVDELQRAFSWDSNSDAPDFSEEQLKLVEEWW